MLLIRKSLFIIFFKQKLFMLFFLRKALFIIFTKQKIYASYWGKFVHNFHQATIVHVNQIHMYSV
jgi:hypothetical protein